MSIFILQDYLEQSEQYLIEWCKSNSGKTGYQLRNAHNDLGAHIGNIIHTTFFEQSKFAILILMRAGLPFGLGIADSLEKKGNNVAVHFVNDHINDELITLIEGRTIILADAVINSGKSISAIYTKLSQNVKNTIVIATTVIPRNSVSNFENLNLMTVRVSDNQYQGAKVNTIKNGKGPDTGDRLFGTI